MNIYIICTSGFPNYGDEVILMTWLSYISELYPNAVIWIDSPNPTQVTCMLEYKNYNIRSIDILWNACKKKYAEIQKEQIDITGYLNSIESCIGDNFHSDIFFEKDVLKNIDFIHIIGGGYINAMWSQSYGLLAACYALKKLIKVPVVMTGAGLMPAIKNKNIKNYIDFFDFVEVRDYQSGFEFNVYHGYDDVFLDINKQVSLYHNLVSGREMPDVIVCLQHDLIDEEKYQYLITLLKERLRKHMDSNLSIGYVEAIPHSDNLAYQLLSEYIDQKNFFSSKEVIHKGLPIKKNQIWYTSRFHHHLVAASGGARGVALSFMPNYYDIKHKSLLNIGTGWAYFSAYEDTCLPDPDLNADFSKIALEISIIKQSLAKNIYEEIQVR